MADTARQALGMLGSRAVCLVMLVLTSAVIARSLEPAGRGIYFMAVTIATTATVFAHLSVEQAQSALWTETELRDALTGNSVPLALALGTLGGIAGTACVAAIGPETLHLPGLSIVATACLGVPLGVAVNYANNIVLLRGRSHVVAWANLARALVQCGVLLALAAAGALTPLSVVWVWVASESVPLLVFIIMGGTMAGRPNLGLARTTVLTGARYHPGPTAAFLLLYVDVFLLGTYTSAEEVGIYTLAATFVAYGRFLIDVLSQVMLNRQFESSQDESVHVTVRITRFAILLAVASALVLVLSAPVMVTAVYGAAFADAVPLVTLLAPGVLALGASRLPSAYLLRLRRARLVVVPSLGALAVNVALSLVLIPLWGAVGCAAASSLAFLLLAVCQTWLFARATGTAARDLVPVPADLIVLRAALLRCVPRRQAAASPPPG
ncbi:polysaccharide biosynthesis C-terminal domain-containing protein [Streptomyces sp. NPDC048479]|uniref:lipopolysaccharide biosynthesis protein n=1 Tax=Streptomyces sp. NPDC048479 TaxID=3154725 RepID=UPI00343C320A